MSSYPRSIPLIAGLGWLGLVGPSPTSVSFAQSARGESERTTAFAAEADAALAKTRQKLVLGLLDPIIGRWAENDAAGALAWIDRLNPTDHPDTLRPAAAVGWARQAPQDALQWARKTWPTDRVTANTVDVTATYGRLIAAIAMRDPTAARTLLDDWQPARSRIPVWRATVTASCRNLPNFAADLIAGFPVFHLRPTIFAEDRSGRVDGLFLGEISSIVARDPRAAWSWSDRLPDGAMRRHARSEIARLLDLTDSAAAAEVRRDRPPGPRTISPDGRDARAQHSLAEASANASDRTTALARFAANAGTAMQQPPGPARDTQVKAIAAEWAQIDRPALLAWILQLEDHTLRHLLHEQLWPAWVAAHPRVALEQFRLLDARPYENKPSMDWLLRIWTSRAPRDALASHLGAYPKERQIPGLITILETWSDSHPEAALAAAAGLPAVEGRYYGQPMENSALIARLLSRVAWRDPAVAFEFARREADEKKRAHYLGTVISAAEKSAPAIATEALFRLPLAHVTASHVQSGIAFATRAAPAQTRAWLELLPDEALRTQGYRAMVEVLVGSDPNAASALLARLSPDGARDLTPGKPAATTTPIQTPPGESDRQAALIETARRMMTTDPAAALASIEALPEAAAARSEILRTWAKHDSSTALAWIRSRRHFGYTRHDLHSALFAHRFESPAAAIRFFAELETDDFRAAAAELVAHRLYDRDPAQSAVWAAGLPPGEARESAISTLLRLWMPDDPEAAGAWLQHLPPGRFRDSLVVKYFSFIGPTIATAHIEAIDDPARRESAIRGYFTLWHWRDRSIAETWLRGISWPEEKKQALLMLRISNPRPRID